jgi:hypothetical protein
VNARIVLLTAALAVGCSSIGGKMGKMEEFISPTVDASKINRIALIAGGSRRSDMQVTARARVRLTEAGIPPVRRTGEWESNEVALREICVQKPDSPDNVDGVLFVQWDRVILHDCASGQIATNISGNYTGIDAIIDRLLRYLGKAAPPAKN